MADLSTSPESAGVQIHTKKVRSLPPTRARTPAEERADTGVCQGIKKMKAACQLAARVLQHAGTLVKVRGT